MTDKQAPESRGTEASNDELDAIARTASDDELSEMVGVQMGVLNAKTNGQCLAIIARFRKETRLAAMRALLATQRSTEPAAGWISVKETPIPRDGGSFIVTDGKSVAPHVRGVISNNPGTSWDWQYGEAITHWLPLPNAPGREPEPAVRGDEP